MTVLTETTWFLTQPQATLTNELSRTYLQTMLLPFNSADALAAMSAQYPLRLSSDMQFTLLQALTTDNLELLARLGLKTGQPVARD